MREFSNMKKTFYKAVDCFNHFRYGEAQSYFNITKNDKEYRRESIYYLLKIDIRLGYYRKAREELSVSRDMGELRKMRLLALIDKHEYNYGRSLEIYDYLVSRGAKYSYLERAFLYMCLGEFNKASRDLSNALSLNDGSIIDYVSFYLYSGMYDKAYNMLKMIDKKKLDESDLSCYEKARLLIMYHLGKDPRSFSSNKYNKYLRDILLDNEEVLFQHVALHKEYNKKFLQEVNLGNLIRESRESICNINRMLTSCTSECFKFQLETPIGCVGDRLINGLNVSTLIGTGKINTIYPVEFSSEFDMEGLSTSEELRKKLII